MANKKINLTYEGDEALINAALEALARKQGWNEQSEKSKEDCAKERVNNFIRSEVQSYNIFRAQELAMQAAQEASTQALDLITVSLEVV